MKPVSDQLCAIRHEVKKLTAATRQHDKRFDLIESQLTAIRSETAAMLQHAGEDRP